MLYRRVAGALKDPTEVGSGGSTSNLLASVPVHYWMESNLSDPYLISDECPELLSTVGREKELTLVLPPTKSRSTNHPHASQIIKDLCIQMGLFDDSEIPPAYAQLGNALEFSLSCGLHLSDPDRYFQPGELKKDRMAGTPDIIDLYDGENGRVDEIKMAWMSVNQDPKGEKFWRYWVQVKAYCHIWGSLKGGVRVWHIVGDWGKNRFPQYRHWGWDFTEGEILENWLLLKRHAKLMKREGRL